MTSANHIAGGIAITGISLSFWDINIFSNPWYLGATVFASLLPDIDHTKSIIGKMFYPIARYIDRKFGHRTITHSLTFYIPVLMIVSFFELNFLNPYLAKTGIVYTLIFGFGMFSHFILDMVTKTGIPLFYPFMRNPCVIPANQNMRIKSGDVKAETMGLAFFILVTFSSYDLFQNGFWTSYNRSFGTLAHAEREFQRSSNIVEIEYTYLFNGELQTGKALILDAKNGILELYENEKIWTLATSDSRINDIDILPKQTEFPFKLEDFNFSYLTAKQINDTLSNLIVSGNINSSKEFIFQNQLIKSELKLDKIISPEVKTVENDNLKAAIKQRISLQEAKLEELRKENAKETQEYNKMLTSLKTAENALNITSDLYHKNRLEKEIIDTRSKIANFNPRLKSYDLIQEEIRQLEIELNREEVTYFSGNLRIHFIPQIYRISTTPIITKS